MTLPASLITGFVALLHLYIAYLEMFAWTTRGRKTFKSFPQHLFEPTRKMAANQGLYNGFLAAGLIWSLCIQNDEWQKHVASFFLICVLVAGIYGAATVQRSVFFIQGLPALLGLLAIVLF